MVVDAFAWEKKCPANGDMTSIAQIRFPKIGARCVEGAYFRETGQFRDDLFGLCRVDRIVPLNDRFVGWLGRFHFWYAIVALRGTGHTGLAFDVIGRPETDPDLIHAVVRQPARAKPQVVKFLDVFDHRRRLFARQQRPVDGLTPGLGDQFVTLVLFGIGLLKKLERNNSFVPCHAPFRPRS